MSRPPLEIQEVGDVVEQVAAALATAYDEPLPPFDTKLRWKVRKLC